MSRRTPGEFAEEYFIEAARKVGFMIVEKTDSSIPWTIRKASEREERQKIDFVLTFLWGDRICCEPLQLTISRNRKDSALRAKLKMFEVAAKIALFWPAKDLTSNEMFGLLEDASHGEPTALDWFYNRLERSFAELFRYREKKRAAKRQLNELTRIMIPYLPKKLRRKVMHIMSQHTDRYQKISAVKRLLKTNRKH